MIKICSSKETEPMKQILTVAAFLILGLPVLHADPSPASDFTNGQQVTWTSKDHPKAKGINLKISYPSSWKAAEGTRPNILQKFVGKSATGMDFMALTTRSLPAPFDKELTAAEKKEFLARDVVAEMLPEGAKMLSYQMTKIDGETCAMAEFLHITERVGMKIAQKGMVFVIPRPGTLLLVQCATGVDAANGLAGLDARYSSVRNLYLLIGSSCVFVDKWEE
jgi:hypothetical protein